MQSENKSSLWYWMLIILPSFAALLTLQREYALGSILVILMLTCLRIGSDAEQTFFGSLGELSFVATVATVLYRFGSFNWMYPPQPSDPALNELFIDSNLLAKDLLFQTSFAVSASLYFAARPLRLPLHSKVVCLFAFVLLAYPAMGYWAWARSALGDTSFQDFAGGTVVFAIAGWAGLALTLLESPRPTTTELNTMRRVIYSIGIMILLLTNILPIGFGGGDEMLQKIYVNNLLAMGAGAVAASLIGPLIFRSWNLRYTVVGFISALACVSSWVDQASDLQAIIFGTFSGLLAIAALRFVEIIIPRDNLDLVVALASGGTSGAILIGFLPNGDLRQQLLGMVICIGLSGTLGLVGWITKLVSDRWDSRLKTANPVGS